MKSVWKMTQLCRRGGLAQGRQERRDVRVVLYGAGDAHCAKKGKKSLCILTTHEPGF